MNLSALNYDIQKRPFEAAGRQYVLKLIGLPTYDMLPYRKYKAGSIYKIAWYPAEREADDDRFGRAGGLGAGSVRQVLTALGRAVASWLADARPVGVTWTAADAGLSRLYKRMSGDIGRVMDGVGYVPLRDEANTYVRSDLKDRLEQQDFSDL